MLLLHDITMYRRYAVGLRRYLKRPLAAADCAVPPPPPKAVGQVHGRDAAAWAGPSP
jgi:hypothetical protein